MPLSGPLTYVGWGLNGRVVKTAVLAPSEQTCW
jgi:hypothetical protein